MTARLTMLMVVAMTIGVVVTGCGGGDASLSSKEFIAQASAICHREKEDILTQASAFAEQHRKEGKSEKELSADLFDAVVLPLIEAELAKIRDLGIPTENGARIEAFLDAEQSAIDATTERESSKDSVEAERRFAQAAKLAQDSGIPDCSNVAQLGSGS